MTVLERWFEEVWNRGREAAIDEMCDLNVVGHGLTDADGNEVHNVTAFKVFYRQFRSAFPDIHIKVEDTVSEGDKTVARCLVTGTHDGHGLGMAPTTNPSESQGCAWYASKTAKSSSLGTTSTFSRCNSNWPEFAPLRRRLNSPQNWRPHRPSSIWPIPMNPGIIRPYC